MLLMHLYDFGLAAWMGWRILHLGWVWFEAPKRSGYGDGECVSLDFATRALCR